MHSEHHFKCKAIISRTVLIIVANVSMLYTFHGLKNNFLIFSYFISSLFSYFLKEYGGLSSRSLHSLDISNFSILDWRLCISREIILPLYLTHYWLENEKFLTSNNKRKKSQGYNRSRFSDFSFEDDNSYAHLSLKNIDYLYFFVEVIWSHAVILNLLFIITIYFMTNIPKKKTFTRREKFYFYGLLSDNLHLK